MKFDNPKEPKESIFKKKGFYIALYSSLGIVILAAAAITIAGLPPTRNNVANNGGVDYSQMQQTLDSTTKQYLTQDQDSQDQSALNGANSGPGAAGGVQAQAPVQNPADSQTQAYAPSTPIPQPLTVSGDTTGQTALNGNVPEDPMAKVSTKTSLPGAQPKKPSPPKKLFKAFTQDTKMSWPVLGQVIMDFSDKLAIYDKTLDQYRTNNSLAIQAAEGTQVKAAADGIVKSVDKTDRGGNTIVIDNGNGWMTTYSQLQDGMLVKPGDVVAKGQVIGGVAKPDIYSILLGSHVDFEVQKDGVPVDPKSVLSN